MASDPETIEDGVFESEAAIDDAALTAAELESAPASGLELERLRFWRRIAHVDRRFEFAWSDTDSTGRPTRVLVVIHKQLSGTFNILRGDVPADSAELYVVHKPLADRWVRRVLLHRVPLAVTDGSRDRTAWKVVASSGVRVTSIDREDNPSTRILGVRVQSGDRDTTITDPLGLVWRHRVMMFEPEAEVAVTVTTERPDDVVFLMHPDRRFFLRPNGDNTYSGLWRVPPTTGVKHIGVNALARGTVFGDAPYSSQAWLWHYVVRGGDPLAGNQ